MDRKTIIRISNELGNQMFMYASAYGISKKLNRNLLIDNESAFKSRKNISKYGLYNFNISSSIVSNKYKFLGLAGYLKRKLFKKVDKILFSKKFFLEIKNKEKITEYNYQVFKKNFSKLLFLEGYFETQKYFIDYEDDIRKEFEFIDKNKYITAPYYNQINNTNSVAICLRQNRFSEGKGNINNVNNDLKSKNFSLEQIRYINKSIKYFKSKLNFPVFYLWSNDFKSLNDSLFDEKITKVIHNDTFISNIDKRALDLFLLSQVKNHIVIPSSFNWWGAWLSNSSNKIILRPSDTSFSEFKLNNKDFWPTDWIEVS